MTAPSVPPSNLAPVPPWRDRWCVPEDQVQDQVRDIDDSSEVPKLHHLHDTVHLAQAMDEKGGQP